MPSAETACDQVFQTTARKQQVREAAFGGKSKRQPIDESVVLAVRDGFHAVGVSRASRVRNPLGSGGNWGKVRGSKSGPGW
jgi:hypothetical protein